MVPKEIKPEIFDPISGLSEEQRALLIKADEADAMLLLERVYQLAWHWADFHLIFVKPIFEVFSTPKVIPPQEMLGSNEKEFVYTIYDFGNKFSTSKAEEMFESGMSMFKMHQTIEKIVYLLVERLKAGDISTETEVQVAFDGHILVQRKAFEVLINLDYNVVITNFTPGAWGDRYLEIMKLLVEKGYGYPPKAPRDSFRKSFDQLVVSKTQTTKR